MRLWREGEILRAVVVVDPGGDVPAHRHPAQEERFEIVEGSGWFRVGRERRVVGPGDRLVAPPGVVHRFKNAGDGPMRVRVEVEPALQLQAFLEEAARLARAGAYNRLGVPAGFGAAVELAGLLDRHRAEILMSLPPPWLLGPLARVARRRAAR